MTVIISSYRLMQSYRNSVCGDVVLNSVNIALRYEDSILDQTYDRIFIRMIAFFVHIHIRGTLKPNFMKYEFIVVEGCNVLYMHFLPTCTYKNSNLKNQNTFDFHIVGLRFCHHPWMPC